MDWRRKLLSFENPLYGKSTDEERARFPVCFQSFIKDHEGKIFLNRMSEEDIEKFLKGKGAYVKGRYPEKASTRHRPFDHKIELKPGEEPPYYRNRLMSARELEVVKKYLDDHLPKGFIRWSTSSAAVPLLLVKKPGGGYKSLC
jgi:hypothetical protein